MKTARRDVLTVFLYGLAGGFGDATGFLLYNTFTGHITGNLVLLMISLSQQAWPSVTHRLLAIVVFLLATRLGFWIGTTKYGKAFLFAGQAISLCALLGLEIAKERMPLLSIALFCATLGLQNGVLTTLHQVDIHATFVSGDFTNVLKPAHNQSAGNNAPAGPILRSLIVGFTSGAFLAAWLHRVNLAAALPLFFVILAFAFCATLLPSKDNFRAAMQGTHP